jgi:hypothetical protein
MLNYSKIIILINYQKYYIAVDLHQMYLDQLNLMIHHNQSHHHISILVVYIFLMMHIGTENACMSEDLKKIIEVQLMSNYTYINSIK